MIEKINFMDGGKWIFKQTRRITQLNSRGSIKVMMKQLNIFNAGEKGQVKNYDMTLC